MWRTDGKERFLVSDDRKFYVAEIRTNAGFDYGAPRFLFDMRADVFNSRNSYVPSRDGQRFLVNMLLETATSPQRCRQLDNGLAQLIHDTREIARHSGSDSARAS